jgi:hypothetical protein
MLLRPEQRTRYWRTQPLDVILPAVVGGDGDGRDRYDTQNLMLRYDGGRVEWRMCRSLAAWRAYLDEVAPRLQSLHIQPDAARFLVFDIDLRGQVACSAHVRETVCAECWPVAQRGVRELADLVGEPFALPPPLVVYSGANGLHVWYRLPPAHVLALAASRKHLIINEILAPNAATRFDAAVTQAQHMIRMPFSWHEGSGGVALPLSATQLGAIPAAVPTSEHGAALAAAGDAVRAWHAAGA